eukprot:738211-Hanusia_phi.AAC.1
MSVSVVCEAGGAEVEILAEKTAVPKTSGRRNSERRENEEEKKFQEFQRRGGEGAGAGNRPRSNNREGAAAGAANAMVKVAGSAGRTEVTGEDGEGVRAPVLAA